MSVETVATASRGHGGRMASNKRGVQRKSLKGPVAPRSLRISPNLDALLEHEDRMRQGDGGGAEPESPVSLYVSPCSTTSASGPGEFGMGLPPPPRRTRGPKSPLTQVVAPIAEVGTGVQGRGNQENVAPCTVTPTSTASASNPYINRAPTLADVLGDDRKGDGSMTWSQQSEGDTGGGVEVVLDRRRPLLQRSSLSSVESIDPPSTVEPEPRISISSTLYPASSADHSLDYDSDMSHRCSYIDLYSPLATQPTFATEARSEPVSPLLFARSASLESLDDDKPPVPTTPKPIFSRPALRSRQSSPKPSLPPAPAAPLPPTTNFLDVDERADLVRKSRKLARVFGQTPGADAMAHQDTNRAALPASVWRARSRKKDLNIYASRRHSMPLTPDDMSFLSLVSPTFEDKSRDRRAPAQNRSSSPTSFIDLSEDHANAATQATQTPQPLPSSSHIDSDAMSLSAPSLDIEAEEDQERRRKRERLAKLHRFLGSRVPANLVLGIDDLEASLPPHSTKSPSSESEEPSSRKWMKRRRSSSAAAPPSSWSEDRDRLKEDLDDKEKAINVRRAQKMEKVFGVAPPQTLYHTRHSASPSIPTLKSAAVLPSGAVTPTETPALPLSRNPNRTSYIQKSGNGKSKSKKDNRPGTSESAKGLLQKGPGAFNGFGFDERLVPVAGGAAGVGAVAAGDRHSYIYNHYQHSLNSLNDILDRDDRESLAELHEYLNTPGVPAHEAPTPTTEDPLPPTPAQAPTNRRLSNASIKSERRRSLPARTSLLSLASLASTASEYTLSSPKPEVTSFQLRRRRAAKLTQFFGVDYRELISDVLESIESGLQLEQQRGTLKDEEVQDLLAKLRNLKTKRQSFV